MSKKCVAGTFATVVCLLVLAPSALAGLPTHLPLPALDIAGLNQVCAAAVDSEGDVYAASLGESKIKVFDPQHNLLASIPNANEPCGLAVDSRGTLYASEKATGNVVKYVPDVFPLSGSPSYGSPATVDSSGEAKGIAVDLEDDRLYVAAGDHVQVYQRDGTSGQDEMQEVLVLPQVTGGTFKLKFAGEETAPIEVVPGAEPKPSDEEIEKALEALPAIGPGNVEVEAGDSDRSHLVTFTNALGSQNLLPLAVNSAGLSGGNVIVESVIGGYAFNGIIGEGELGEAVAVASYTYELDYRGGLTQAKSTRYLSVVDAATDTVKVLAGPIDIKELKLSQEVDGTGVPDSSACPKCSEGFGSLDSAALAADQANGHLFVYDNAHEAVDEFEATGEHYLDQVSSSSFSAEPASVAAYSEQDEILHLAVQATGGSFTLSFDGETTAPIPVGGASEQPSGTEIEAALELFPAVGAGNVSVVGKYNFSSSGGSYTIHFTGALGGHDLPALKPHSHGLTGGNGALARVTSERDGSGPGRLYVSSGPGTGDELLAFGPLAPPSRAPFPELSQALEDAGAVRTDSVGNVYLSVGAEVRVYSPNGQEIGDFHHSRAINDLAVDSTGKVYVAAGEASKNEVTYYTPDTYPPVSGTQYARHEPGIYSGSSATVTEVGALTVNPGDDRVFLLLMGNRVMVLDSAAHGSTVLDENFGSSFGAGSGVFGGNDNRGIDVYGANGNVYISQGPLISVLDPTGTKLLAQIGGRGSPRGKLFSSPAIAVDQSNGHVLAFSSSWDHAREYEATGAFVAEFGPITPSSKAFYRIAIDNACALHDPPLTETTTPTCAEFDPAAGNAYVAYDAMTAFGPLGYGEAPAAVTGVATGLGLGNGGATLNGTADPRGFQLEDCRFEYLSDGEYQQNVAAEEPAFNGAQTVPCVPGLAEIGKGSKPVPVHADIGGLDPEGRYRFRLVAENEFGAAEGKAGLFGPPLLAIKSALPVLYDEATLRAGVDPSGLQTTYRFQYGKAAGEYDQSTPSQVLPPGDGQVAVEAALTGLAEGTEYHFRIVAENEAKTVTGPDQALVTLRRAERQSCPNAEYRTGLSANLPDCRAYELVTPAEANGALISGLFVGSSDLGFNHYLVVPRGPGGGEALTFGATTTLPGFEGSGRGDGYRAQRGDGAHPAGGWGIEILSPSYAQGETFEGGALDGASDQLYSFWHAVSTESEASLSTGTYLRVPGAPAQGCTLQPQSHFELAGCASLGTDPEAAADYVSAGGSHVIFSSKAHLEEAAAPAGTRAIYDRAAGAETAQVLSLAPGGAPFGAGEDASYFAASEDGSAVVFRVGGTLYLHRDDESVEIAEAPSTFAGLAEDGSRVFYAADSSGTAPAALFACEVKAGPCAGPGAQSATEIAPDSIFVSVSPDGSAALFSSKTVLPGIQANENGEVAEAEKQNLYAWDAESGTFRFVAILDPADFSAFGGNVALNLGKWVTSVTARSAGRGGRGLSPTRSTPDGGVFVFQSHAQLTTYENEGRGEIYRYEPAAAPGGQLLCISCDPSGAPPSADAALEDLNPGSPLAVDERAIVPNVTDDGSAVFFQSFDRLLPEDANDVQDVYEWKAQGSGGCKRSGGCLALISSGQGEYENYLYGMSADGHDVFIRTPERILPVDVAGSQSLYDARVEGGIPDPVPAAPCQGDSCQGNGATPPALPAPASTGASDGNLPAEGAPCRRGKRKVKGRCVKPHKKHTKPRQHKRPQGANNDRRAGR